MAKIPLQKRKYLHPKHPRWPEWLEICTYTGWNPDGPLKPVLYRGFILPYNPTLGVNQEFYNTLVKRVKKKKAIRMTFVGDAGTGKSYAAIYMAMLLQRGKFTIDQIVFSGEDYIRLQGTLKDGQCIMIEEPTYVASARGWQAQWQQAVVRTIESSRFQNNPLLIPVVNRMLLDKIVREHYIKYVVELFDRGIGRVYEYKQSQWRAEGKKYTESDIAIFQPGVDLARCGRETCLGCPELPTCNKYIWPQYERKREEWVKYYQSRDKEEAQAKENKESETSQDRFREVCKKATQLGNILKNDKGEYDVARILYHVDGVTNREDARFVKNMLDSGTIQPPK